MEAFYLGIDVSKGYADFVILNSKKQRVEENFQLDDTFDGHSCLRNRLLKFCKHHPASAIYAAVESTGGYENNWYESLSKFNGEFNLQVSRLNPLGVNANSKAELNRNITDKISAQNVAEYMISHQEKVSYKRSDRYASLRKQWVFIKMLTKQSTQLLNQLESLVYTANPEILVYCKDGIPEWVLKLLARYPTSLKLSKARALSVAQIPYVTLERAEELISMAKKSIASSSDEITEQLIITTVRQIINLKETIKLQIKTITEKCTLPEVDLLKTFTGIGELSAIGLMVEIQSVERFPSAKKLASFFGLHPVFKMSGDGSSGFRMSKMGRKEPRRILFMVTLSAISSNPYIKSIYEEHVKRGISKMAAIGICMHKILRIIYGMLKNNKEFDPEVDRKNKKGNSKREETTRQDKNRRFQNFDPKAPISRRQNLKREERKQPHSDNTLSAGSCLRPPSLISV